MRSFIACILLVGCGPSETFVPNPDLGKPPGFAVGGTVDGLAGKLTLANNGGDLLQVDMAGPFVFAAKLADGAAYDVTVFAQPADQTCTVSGGQGSIAGADVMSVQVSCADSSHSIGGSVTGLAGMVTLRDNGADDLTVMMDGSFTFATRVADGATYDVSVSIQPAAQLCTVMNGQGTAVADVSDVMVACQPTFAVGGTVSGLSGTLTLRDNFSDDLTVTADGNFTFATRLVDGAGYLVTFGNQPVGQRCDVANGTGTIAAADVSNIAVTCQNVHTVGGTITGLTAGTLILQDNGGNDLVVNYPNSSFTFTTALTEGAGYNVTIAQQPTGQICTVSAAGGNIGTSDVTDVMVSCALLQVRFDEIYARPGIGAYGDSNGDGVRDASDDEFVEIINLESAAVDISGWLIRTGTTTLSNRFSFPAGTTLQPGQRAVVFGGGTPTGSFGGALVFTAAGLSLTDAPASAQVVLDSLDVSGARLDSFTYTGSTFGSSCTNKCQSVTRDPGGGGFVAHVVLSGSTGILFSPGVSPDQAIPKLEATFASPAAGSNTAAITGNLIVQFNMFMDSLDFDVAHIQLFASDCVSPANPVTLSSVTLGTDGTRAVLAPAGNLQWAQQYCVVVSSATRSFNDTAMGASASYTFSTVNPGPTYTIGGNLSGLVGTVVLQNQGGDDLTRSSPGPYAFVTPWPDGASYSVSVKTQPAGQLCALDPASPDPASGTVPGRDVTVDLLCKNVHNLGGTVSGLSLGSLVLTNNGGDAQTVTFGGTQNFAFPPVAEGDAYDVEVQTQPTGQHCVVAANTGNMGTSDIALAVTCATLHVVIDEIHPAPADWAYGDANGDGISDSAQDEFIEVLNLEAFPVDIGGFALQYGGSTRHTFSNGAVLAPGQRAVVFGGGAPHGSFGGALVESVLSSGLSNGGTTVTLASKSSGGLPVDTVTYPSTGSCGIKCASLTRNPPGTGVFTAHNLVAGTGILWSPGTAPLDAIPKLAPKFSFPKDASIFASVVGLVAQFNMFMHSTDLVAANFHLYASSCNNLQNEHPIAITPGLDNSWVTVSPSPSPLDFSTTYCLVADPILESGVSPSPSPATLGTAQTIEFTTRAPVSLPGTSIVISEVGGCRVASSGSNPCGGVANDEFIELYNPTNATVDITGWSLQRRTAGGGTTCLLTLNNPSPSPAPILPPGGYYLVGGVGYDSSHYAGTPDLDYPTKWVSAGSINGADESIVLIAGTNCSTSAPVIDTLSVGNVTERPGFLALPAIATTYGTNNSIERKACFNSTMDTSGTGMLATGGQETQGNSEKIGGSNADFLLRPSPNPQNARSGVNELRTCP